MIPHGTADWPAAASSPTNLPDLCLRRIGRPIGLAVVSCATNHASMAPASSACSLVLDPAGSHFRVRYPLRSVPIRSRLRCGLGPSASRRFQ